MNVTVADLMTRDVCTVDPETGFKEMVRLLEERHISALPVVAGDGRVTGVVSEADLLLKEEREELDERRFFESRARRLARAKSAATTAASVMSSPAITIEASAPVERAARLMHERAVKRLPVLGRDGRLVGIISRSDVLKVFMRDDIELEREIVDDVIVRTMWIDPQALTVHVDQGIVHLGGEVDRRSDATILPDLIASVHGVVSVDAGRLTYRYDDSRRAGRI